MTANSASRAPERAAGGAVVEEADEADSAYSAAMVRLPR